MTTRRGAAAALVGLVVLVAGPTACSKTAGTPVAASEVKSSTTAATSGSSDATSATTAVPTLPTRASATSATAAPTGPPVGTAIMKVIGGNAPVTIRYQINGGPEQTESGVSLPWEKQYSVYAELETSVTADGGAAELTCTIIMGGDKLVSFKSERRPTCNFAYWG